MPRTILQFIGRDVSKKFAALAKKTPELKYRGLYDTASQAKAEFEKTTASWRNKPEFVIEDTPRGMTVTTNSDVYGFVDKGTRPHKIRAKNVSQLAFQTAYKPKTIPNTIGSGPGGASGKYAFAKEVNHPGSKARNFTKIIFANAQKNVGRNVTARLKEGMEAVGL